MIKPVIKWVLACTIGVTVAVVILVIFTMLARPGKVWFAEYLAGYFQRGPDYGVTAMDMELEAQRAMEEWARPLADLPHCEFKITGRVTQNDGIPIEDAEVKIYNVGAFNSGDYRYTDQNGKFAYSEFGIDICDKEQMYVSISKNGFESFFVLAKPDEIIDISLSSYRSY